MPGRLFEKLAAARSEADKRALALRLIRAEAAEGTRVRALAEAALEGETGGGGRGKGGETVVGELVIINEFDKPCTRLIAEVERLEGETVIARYVTTGTRMTHCSAHVSEVTPVWKFGVMYEIKGGYITAAQITRSQATYRDGKPRNWQPAGEEARVKLRKRAKGRAG